MSVPISNESVEAFYTAFKRDTIVFQERLPEMLREYPGDFVAIHNGEVLDHAKSWDELVDIAKIKYPNDYVLIEQVRPASAVPIDVDSMDT